MNQQPDPQWSQPDQFSSMVAIGEQEFADLVDLDLDIAGLEFPIYGDNDNNQDGAGKISDGVDLSLLPDQSAQQHHPHDGHPAHTSGESIAAGTDLFDFMPVPFSNQQDVAFAVPQQMQPQMGQSIIPPTPNSVEMHGDAARYLQQLDAHTRAVLEQQYQTRKGDAVNFTPLVSPAVTPHDSRFHLQHDYTVHPGAYFSPLTSPALEGQHHPYHNNTSTSSVATSSPVDLDVDMICERAASQQAGHKSRSRKRPGSPRAPTAGSRVRESPIVKPQQRRKATMSSVIPSQDIQNILDQSRLPRTSPTSPNFARSQYRQQTSSNDSISPEPLSEAVMGPPPKPTSAKPSPAIGPQSRSNSSSNLQDHQGAVPATPASLMHLPQPSPRSNNGQSMKSPSLVPTPVLEELTLPEAATAGLDSSEGGEATPRITARKTPKLGPLHTPGSSALSPAMKPGGSTGASTVTSPHAPSGSPAIARKVEVKGRPIKKRGSVGNSSMVSPALRPKISPSIKPLLPEGAAHTEDSHTLLLATRSNYQNLIEGTTVPGVNYPSELSTNLTSKRTSHKIAEQGRRNRINLALQEMLSLLPKGNGSSPQLNLKEGSVDGDDDDEKGGKGGLGKGSGSSKAATVESAIEYIKALQKETKDRKQAIEEKDREVEELRKKLGEMEKKLGESNNASHDGVSATEKSESGRTKTEKQPKE